MILFEKFSTNGDTEVLHFQSRLAKLGGLPPVSTARALDRMLARACEAGSSRRRMRLLELAFPNVEAVSTQVTCTLRQALLPLDKASASLFESANALLKRTAERYTAVANEGGESWRGLAYARQRRLAVSRALACHAARIDLAYAIRAPGSAKSWACLHALFRQAGNWLGGAGPSSLSVYHRTLAWALAEPMNMDEAELSVVRTCVTRLASHVDLVELPREPSQWKQRQCCFVFNPQGGERPAIPLSRLRSAIRPDQGPVVDLSRAAEAVRMQIEALNRGEPQGALGYAEGPSPEWIAGVLSDLLSHWTGTRERRFRRKPFFPRAEAVVGFEHLCSFLRHSGAARQQDDRSHQTEWQIRNESATGLALRFIGGSAIARRKGELIGLKSAEHDTFFVGVIQRVEMTGKGWLEAGVRKIGSGARVVTVFREKGDDGRAAGPLSAVLVLKAPCERGAFVVVLPSELAVVGDTLRIPAFGNRNGMVVIAVPEHCESAAVVLVKRVDALV